MMMTSTQDSYPLYVWKRIKRLAMPAWIFLVVYFLLNWAIRWAPEQLKFTTIAYNFAFLQDGAIGYIWIIRIFLLVALLGPPIRYLAGRIKSTSVYLGMLLICWCVYEAILWISLPHLDNPIGRVASMYIFYGVSYGIIFALGARFREFSSRQIILISGVGLATFLVMMAVLYQIKGQLVPTVHHKSPPTSYYMSNALFAGGLLYLLSGWIVKVVERLWFLERFVMFVAKNSIWVYLWHIIAVQLTISIQEAGSDQAVLLHLTNNWILNYICVYAFGVIVTWVQVTFVTELIIPALKSDKARRNIRTVLTG